MPSPFPGMNPFLESADAWQTFHANYVGALEDQLAEVLPDGYYAKTEVTLILHEPSAEERLLTWRADVGLGEEPEGPPLSRPTAASAVADPAVWHTAIPDVQEERHYSTNVHDVQSRRIVTVIEHLSPSNKVGGSNFSAYSLKRTRLVNEGVNLVEIDLLRKGGRMPFANPPPGDYCVSVARAADAPRVDVWPIRLRDPLPTVPVPLDPQVDDVSLNLMAALHEVHDRKRYDRWIYRNAARIDPPLSPDDAAWALDRANTIKRPAS